MEEFSQYPCKKCGRRIFELCRICHQHICNGELYYDGGIGNRAHEACVRKEASNMIKRSGFPAHEADIKNREGKC